MSFSTMSTKINPLNVKVQEKMVRELYKAGLSPWKLKKLLSLNDGEMMMILGEDVFAKDNPNALNDDLVNKILYDADYPVAVDVVIANEKERFATYSKLEQSCLGVMQKLLNHYSKLPIGDDPKQDAFLAKLAKDFIQVTHSARQELIQKYAIDKEVKDSLKIEFIEGVVTNESK